jgi:hypothetical protein
MPFHCGLLGCPAPNQPIPSGSDHSQKTCSPAAAAIINGAGPLQTFKGLWERDKHVYKYNKPRRSPHGVETERHRDRERERERERERQRARETERERATALAVLLAHPKTLPRRKIDTINNETKRV